MKIIISRDQVILKADPTTLLAIVMSIENFSKDKGFKVEIEHEMKDFSLIDQIRTITHTENIESSKGLKQRLKEGVKTNFKYTNLTLEIFDEFIKTVESSINNDNTNTDTNTSTSNSTNPTR